jgi:large subunit ribosomal protein L25
MKKVSLSGSKRENVGKKDAAKLRREGRVPAVVYGGGEQIHFHVKETEMNKLVYTQDVYQIDLDVDGAKSEVIIQEMQQHPVTSRVRHVDFLKLDAKKVVKVKLPVIVSGMSPGVMAGGKMQQVFRKLRVEGLPGDLPESINVDITPLNIGDAIRISHINIEGCKILDAANAVVVSVKMARGAKASEEVEEEVEATEEGAEEGAEA